MVCGRHLPELPDDKKARFIKEYGLTPYDAGVLIAEQDQADYYEAVAKGRDGKAAANWVINELFGRLNKEGLAIADSPVSATQLGGMLDLLAKGEIVGIAGLMGTGRTELAMSLFGHSYGRGISGTVRMGGHEVDTSSVTRAIAAGLAYSAPFRTGFTWPAVGRVWRRAWTRW